MSWPAILRLVLVENICRLDIFCGVMSYENGGDPGGDLS